MTDMIYFFIFFICIFIIIVFIIVSTGFLLYYELFLNYYDLRVAPASLFRVCVRFSELFLKLSGLCQRDV